MPPAGGMQCPHRVRRWLTILIIAVLTAVIAVLTWLMPKPHYWALDFNNNLWAPANLLMHGQSPYYTDSFFDNTETIWFNAVWFPPVIGLLGPLGWLDMQLAADLWFLLGFGLIIAIVWATQRHERVAIPPFAVLIVALSPPLLPHLQYGQFGLLAAFLLLVAARFVAKQRYLLAGLLAAVGLSKPQLALLALPGLWLASARLGKRRGGLILPAGTFLGLALSTLPLWIIYPNWIPDFLRALERNLPWLQPTLFTVLPMWLGPAGLAIAILVALGAFGLNLWLWWKYPPEEVLPWSLGLTAVAAPYIWTWDFVLFLPLICRSLLQQRTWIARVTWAVGYALCWGLILGLRAFTDDSDCWHFWMPWFFFLLVLAGHTLESRFSRAGRQPLLRHAR